jgi:hypothetical protein
MVVLTPNFNLHGEATIPVLTFEKRGVQENRYNLSL